MDIAVLRDWVIVIGGFLLLILIILASTFSILLYRDIKALTTEIKNTIKTAKQMVSSIGATATILRAIINFFKKKSENKPAEG